MSYPFPSYSHATQAKNDDSRLFTHPNGKKSAIVSSKSKLHNLKGATRAENKMPKVQERDFPQDHNMHVLRIQFQALATRSIFSKRQRKHANDSCKESGYSRISTQKPIP